MVSQPTGALPGPLRDPRLLVLDFEASLSGFLTPRRPPRLAPALLRVLRSAARTNRLVVCSATGVDVTRRLLKGIRADLIGEHGWELWLADGHKAVHCVPPWTQRRLAAAASDAAAFGWGSLLVRRRCSLALTTRGLPRERADFVREMGWRLWSPRFETDGLRIFDTPDGPELRAHEHGARSAVMTLVRLARTRPAVLFATTEDASGKPSPEVTVSDRHDVPTTIEVRLRDHRDLIQFLERGAACLDGSREAPGTV